MLVRSQRRWTYLTMDEVRDYARKADPTALLNTDPLHSLTDSTDCLAGREFKVVFENGPVWTYSFVDASRLKWESSNGERGEDLYQAAFVPGREDVVFVHHYKSGFELPKCCDLFLDLEDGYAVGIDAFVGHPDNPREVVRDILFGEIAGMAHPTKSVLPHYTQELTGRALYWRAAGIPKLGVPGHGIKYIFSSALFHTYVMYRGDRCWMSTTPGDYIKVKDDLYILTVVEERQAGFQLVMLMDLKSLRDRQSGFGIGGAVGEPMNLESWMHSSRQGEYTTMDTLFDEEPGKPFRE